MNQNAGLEGHCEWVDAPDFQDWLNDLMDNSPACCWDQDEAMISIATAYVRHLEAEVKRLGGSLHQPGWHDDDVPPRGGGGL